MGMGQMERIPGWGWAAIGRDVDGPVWTIWARMDRIVGKGIGWDGEGPGRTGLPGWGWARLDRIAVMETGTDRLGWGWAGIGWDGVGWA